LSLGSNNPLWGRDCLRTGDYHFSVVAPLFPANPGKPSACRRKPFSSVDGLRGYLAFGVFIHHVAITWVYLHTGEINVPPSNFYTQIGLASVALFFMITGFLFWGRLLKHGRHHDWLAFAVSRVFRLYPLYLPLLALVIFSVLYIQDWELKDSPGEVVRQVFGMARIRPSRYQSVPADGGC
jgi:peptidoglycan/LPS O-acetylase OafA/YrhL